MPKFKNISKRSISVIHAGRKINIKPGQIVDGPVTFGMYNGLKELSESEISKYHNAAKKVIKYKGPSRSKAVVSPDVMKNYIDKPAISSQSKIDFIDNNKFYVLEDNKNRSLHAIEFINSYPKNKIKPRVAVCLIGNNTSCKKFVEKIQHKSNYQNYKIYQMDGDGSILPSTKDSALDKLNADFVIKNSAGEPIEDDYITEIVKYGIVNTVKLPDVYSPKILSRKYVSKDIKENYVIKSKVKLSIATLTHNIEQYTRFLEDLSKQKTSYNFEVISLPNYNNEYKSCAEALNVAKMVATGEVVVLCHQDLRIPPGWVQNIMRHIESLNNQKIKWGVLGMAGAAKTSSNPSPHSQYNVLYLSDKIQNDTSISTIFRNTFGTRKEVQCIDELCLIMNRDLPVWFDEKVCNHYHWYGADICLAAMYAGYKNFAIDAECLHLSNGQENLSSGHAKTYVDNAVKIFKKWSKHFDYWQTTTGVFMSKEKVFIPTIFILINRNKPKEKKLPELVRIT